MRTLLTLIGWLVVIVYMLYHTDGHEHDFSHEHESIPEPPV